MDGKIVKKVSIDKFINATKANATQRAYRIDFEDFERFCSDNDLHALPAESKTVAEYLATLASSGKKYATIARRASAISTKHKNAGYPSPTYTQIVKDTLHGIPRVIGKSKRQAKPLRIEQIRKIVMNMPIGLAATRNKAILLLGYFIAGRRSEIAALKCEDLCFDLTGMRVLISKSKTDQEGRGVVLGISEHKDTNICPVIAVKEWLRAANISSGALFRPIDKNGKVKNGFLEGRDIARIISMYAPGCTGHSLRSGCITDLYSNGIAETIIKERSRHKTFEVMSQYRREANIFAFDYTNSGTKHLNYYDR